MYGCVSFIVWMGVWFGALGSDMDCVRARVFVCFCICLCVPGWLLHSFLFAGRQSCCWGHFFWFVALRACIWERGLVHLFVRGNSEAAGLIILCLLPSSSAFQSVDSYIFLYKEITTYDKYCSWFILFVDLILFFPSILYFSSFCRWFFQWSKKKLSLPLCVCTSGYGCIYLIIEGDNLQKLLGKYEYFKEVRVHPPPQLISPFWYRHILVWWHVSRDFSSDGHMHPLVYSQSSVMMVCRSLFVGSDCCHWTRKMNTLITQKMIALCDQTKDALKTQMMNALTTRKMNALNHKIDAPFVILIFLWGQAMQTWAFLNRMCSLQTRAFLACTCLSASGYGCMRVLWFIRQFTPFQTLQR